MSLKPISNRKLTLLRKLNRKKYREKEHLFLVEGDRAVEQVIQNGRLEVQELFFDDDMHQAAQDEWRELVDRIPVSLLTHEEFLEVTDTDSPQNVLALCVMPDEITLSNLSQKGGLIIATDAIQDPGNLGTIIRTASWFGAAGLLSGKGTVDLFHPKVVRSTAGATGVIPYRNVEVDEALTTLEAEGWNVLLLDADADSVSLSSVQKEEKTVVVIGNEAHGIDKKLFRADRTSVRISSPGSGGNVESLNAAIAASIAMYALS